MFSWFNSSKDEDVKEEESPSLPSSTSTSEDGAGQVVLDTALEGIDAIGSFFTSIGTTLAEAIADEAKDFIEEKRKNVKNTNADNQSLEPPWIVVPQEDSPGVEEEVKRQILSLVKNRRTFLEGPPAEADFEHNFASGCKFAEAVDEKAVTWDQIWSGKVVETDADSPIPEYVGGIIQELARICLQADQNLQHMRFSLVPKSIQEPYFWRNYFYRVKLIRDAHGVPFSLSTLVLSSSSPSSPPSASSQSDSSPSSLPPTAPTSSSPECSSSPAIPPPSSSKDTSAPASVTSVITETAEEKTDTGVQIKESKLMTEEAEVKEKKENKNKKAEEERSGTEVVEDADDEVVVVVDTGDDVFASDSILSDEAEQALLHTQDLTIADVDINEENWEEALKAELGGLEDEFADDLDLHELEASLEEEIQRELRS